MQAVTQRWRISKKYYMRMQESILNRLKECADSIQRGSYAFGKETLHCIS